MEERIQINNKKDADLLVHVIPTEQKRSQQAANLTSILEVACSIPGPAQWVKDLVLP